MTYFLDNFLSVSFAAVAQEDERIDDILIMLDMALQNKDDEGPKELASKQHSMWIAELLDNSWSDQVISYMTALKTKF